MYQQLVEGRVACQDERAIHHLNRALPQTDEVSTNPYTTPGDIRECKSLVVRAGGLAGNHPGATQVLYADAVHLREGGSEGGREGEREGGREGGREDKCVASVSDGYLRH